METTQVRLLGAFLSGGAAVCAAQLLYRYLTSAQLTQPTPPPAKLADCSDQSKAETVLKREQLSRNEQFFGEEAQKKIEGSFVVVVGVGELTTEKPLPFKSR